VKQAKTAGTARRFLGSFCSLVPLSWTEIQAKFNRASRPPQGFPAADPASFAASNAKQPDTPLCTLGGQNHEDCRHRRHWPHRIKARQKLQEKGHGVIAAAPNTGVNTITGEGLKDALSGAQVVVDLANAPVWEDKAVLEFFETSGRNLMAAEKATGVKHHLALSIVGSDRSPDSGYLRAKVAQENLINASGIPYTILRSTQFSSSSAVSSSRAQRATWSGCRPRCSSRLRRTTWSPTWPS
jgi:hypothetical protein